MTKNLLDRFRIPALAGRRGGVAALVVGLALVLGAQAVVGVVGSVPSEPDPVPATEADAQASPTDGPTEEPVATAEPAEFNLAGAGARLIVNVRNQTDATYDARGRTQLNQIPAPRVAPVNAAIAQSSCVDCETMAVALQINVYRRGTSFVAPQNAAVAANGACVRCFTLAVAIQYVIPVDDPTRLPADLRRLARGLDAEVHDLANDRATPVRVRLTELIALIDRFRQFAAYVDVRLGEEAEPAATSAGPDASPLPEETDEPMADPSVTPEPSSAPTETSSPPASEPPATPVPDSSGSPEPGESSPSPSPTAPPGEPSPSGEPPPSPSPAT